MWVIDRYRLTRNSLIRIVQKIHPERKEVKKYFPRIAEFIRSFSTIVSLNYDLILYWARMWAIEDNSRIVFKDCFDNGQFQYNWEKYREALQSRGERKSVLVFYPHGNLALGINTNGDEQKIGNEDIGLLSQVFRKWESGQLLPLFVSEGTSAQKLNTIQKSRYLRRVYDSVMHQCYKSVAIYGSSLQENDEHILRALLEGGVRKIAVSVHKTHGQSWKQICDAYRVRINKVAMESIKKPIKPVFFDAQSEGAWIY
ncbi:MAG: DUF4917 family protein [Chloroflexi bacterium]|nr:DUF4917 family protein [Chloroflexota bacterium]